MRYSLQSTCFGATLCTAVALAQAAPGRAPEDAATSNATTVSPVAYVYVSNYIGTTASTEVHAFAAAPNGSLSPIPGSPFNDGIVNMAVNGKYLMGGTDNDININAYYIQPDGAISFWAQTNIITQNQGCGSAENLVFDHTGSSLYNFDYDGGQCANNTYEAFNVVKSDGKLTFLGDAGDSEALYGPLTFIGNNEFAYGSACYHSSGMINGFKRNSNGSLTQLSINPPFPSAPQGGYCPFLAAADPTNHLAIPVQLYVNYGTPAKPYQLAVYTADGSGNLTTTSTYSNMPYVAVGNVNAIQMAPSGKLVAVAGSSGLQVLHFNGAAPVTGYTGLLATTNVGTIFWDNANHLYAISSTGNKLYVFTVTPTGYSQAPGSPYAINAPAGLIVQPLPRY